MLRSISIFALSILAWVTVAGAQGSDREQLLHLHAEVIRAHVEGNVDLWMSTDSDEYVSVNRGEVSFPTLSERRARRQPYLEATTFTSYRDLREPIVRVSDDGTLGWVIVEVEVSGHAPGDDGEPEEFFAIYAWIELYEKSEDGWRRVGNVSNRRP